MVYNFGADPAYCALAFACMFSFVSALFSEVIYLSAMLYYDYVLTLEDEIGLIWRRPFRPISYLYIVVRYGTILTTTLNLFTHVRPNNRTGFGMTGAR